MRGRSVFAAGGDFKPVRRECIAVPAVEHTSRPSSGASIQSYRPFKCVNSRASLEMWLTLIKSDHT